MSNSHYKSLLVNRIKSFIKESKIADKHSHMPTRGEVRESGLRKLIKDLLPSTWEIGSGIIIDENDHESKQIDIVVFYREALPSLFYTESKNAIFPIESCSVAIEVKTTSNSKEIKKTVKNFNQLKSLIPQHEKAINPIYSLRPLRVYIALDSNLSKKDEFERYQNIDKNYLTDPAIEIICVIGKGLWYYIEHQPDPEDKLFNELHPRPKIRERGEPIDRRGRWHFIPNDAQYSELLYFICLLVNRSMLPFTHGSVDIIDYVFSEEDKIEFTLKDLERQGLLKKFLSNLPNPRGKGT